MDPELKAYLDKGFSSINQLLDTKLGGINQRLDTELGGINQRLDTELGGINQRLDTELGAINQRLDTELGAINQRLDRLESDIRGAYILIEDGNGRVRLVAEGVTNVSEQVRRLDEKVSKDLDEVRTFNRLSYLDLDARVRRLEAV